MHYQYWYRSCAICLLGVGLASLARANEPLMEMSLAELMKVEINLDDAFDVFDGLVATRKVSVASGKRQEATRAPAVTTVITAQDLEATGARDVVEALASVPGLYLARDSLYHPVFVMRGIYSLGNPEVLVLLNGVPLKRVDTGNRGRGWRGIPVPAVKRIEIIRGPGSAVHGADAFSGIINIITKTGRDIEGTEVGARVGRWNSQEAWALHGRRYGKLEAAFSLAYRRTDGSEQVIQADAQTLLDRRTGSNASLAPGAVNLRNEEWVAHVDLARGNWRARGQYQGIPATGLGAGSYSKTLDPDGVFSNHRYALDIIHHNPMFTPNWDVRAELNYVRDSERGDMRNRPPGMIMPTPNGKVSYPNGVIFQPAFATQHVHFGVSGFYAGFRHHLLRVGAGYRHEDQYEVEHVSNFGLDAQGKPISPLGGLVDISDSPYSVYPEVIRNNTYFFLQDTWRVAPAWDLTLGARHDHYSDFGDTTNPRAALVWQASPRVTAKLLYGRAFRAPSIRELYVRNNATLAGNPDLKPETIDTWELATTWRAASSVHVTASVYTFSIQDKIQYISAGANTPLKIPRNHGEQKGRGFELEARWKMHKRASLLANYSHAKSELDGAESGNYPASQAYFRMDWLLRKNWYLDAQAHWMGEIARPAGDSRPALDGFSQVDLTLRYKNLRDPRWNFALGVRNLFDREGHAPETIEIPQDLPLAGRDYFAEIRYRF